MGAAFAMIYNDCENCFWINLNVFFCFFEMLGFMDPFITFGEKK